MIFDYHRPVSLYVIGNGFDLHHWLPTSYKDFKVYLTVKNKDLVNTLDSILSEKGFNPDDIETWSKLEQFLSEFPNMDFEKLFDYAFDSSESDSDRAEYWNTPGNIAQEETSKICNILVSIKDSFKEWIELIRIENVKRDKTLFFPSDAFFLNFNYTKTLESVYNIPENRCLHIHQKENEYVLGHNQEKDPPYLNPDNPALNENGNLVSDDPDVRFVDVRHALNAAYEFVYGEYFKNSAKLLQENAAWLNCVSNAYEIVFMGLSMGNEDFPYLDFISRKARNCDKIKVYYHTQQDLLHMSVILSCKFPKAKIDFLRW